MQKKAILFLTILLLSNIPSLYYGIYLDHAWFDTAQHFLGGFFVAMLMAGYLKDHLTEDKLKNALIVVGATIFIGVIWEFSEYIANQTLVEPFYRWFGIRAYFMGDLQDTIMDLLMDTLGGMTLFIVHSVWNRNKAR
jgi:uncharacterized membrane protein YjdF